MPDYLETSTKQMEIVALLQDCCGHTAGPDYDVLNGELTLAENHVRAAMKEASRLNGIRLRLVP